MCTYFEIETADFITVDSECYNECTNDPCFGIIKKKGTYVISGIVPYEYDDVTEEVIKREIIPEIEKIFKGYFEA